MVGCGIILLSLLLVGSVYGQANHECELRARTESGWVCGARLVAQNGAPYASFRAIPYAKQPLGELRFKELEPAEPWEGILDATTDGPVCYQHNIFFGALMAPRGVSEACIHVNVHVLPDALPRPGQEDTSGGLPILLFMHGGGWISGSGDADMNGPEFLVGKGVIVITFNYRVDVLGFLYLNTTKVPGNNGLRDATTVLRWVQRNARNFGGDPDQVTLAGESSGSTNVHLLSLSPVTKGLFKRLWLMSGTVIPTNYIATPAYAQQLANKYLTILGLNGTDYDEVHDQLVQMPIEELHNASAMLLPQSGLTSFMPVQESELPGVTAMVAGDPETLIANGKGDDIPVVVGYNNNECKTFLPRLININIVEQYKANPLIAVFPQLVYTLPGNVTAVMSEKIGEKYFGEQPILDGYVQLCTEGYFARPPLKYVRDRAARRAAPVYLYKFSYEAEHSALKLALNLHTNGSCHIEDLNYILKVNSVPVLASTADDNMKEWVSDMVANFVKTGSPSLDNSWPAQSADQPLQYQEFMIPQKNLYHELSAGDKDFMSFFDKLDSMA